MWIIWRSSSLDLLREESKGEKEPKANIFLAGLAVILLAIGYYIALSVDNPISALTNFFIAVLLVIFGTYFFYVSFTVWYLKRKKKRASYYKPHNFITTSSMLYRMKANAVGLGNITILLSMTIVTVVVSLGVFIGTENVVQTQYPREAQIFSVDTKETPDQLRQTTQKMATDHGIKISHLSSIYMASSLSAQRKASSNDQFITSNEVGSMIDKNNYTVTLTTRDSLDAIGNKDLPALDDQEILLTGSSASKDGSLATGLKTVHWYGKDYQVKDILKDVKNFPEDVSLTNSMMIIFANNQALEKALDNYNNVINKDQGYSQSPMTLTLFDLPAADKKAMNKAFKQTFGADNNLSLSYRSEALQDQRAQIGGFVFVGFVLGMSFILGAALIIYYKQLSEGAQDKRSFKILQEVGLSKDEVQKTIKSQVRMIFFLPLVITILHYAGAYLMIEKIVMLFGITNRSLIFMIGLATIALLAAIYYLIYKATSRVYYHIVER